MNQAKRIFEKFDEVLYGPSPEVLVEEVHLSLKTILQSDEAREFVMGVDLANDSLNANQTDFLKKIIESISHILPITIRNKSLDGEYFRTALSLLGAAEYLFTRYVPDVRNQANPAGFTGMCSTMHAQLERCAIYNGKLKPLRDFMSELKVQYQASLGLGSPFPNDAGSRARKRQKRSRGSGFFDQPGSQGYSFGEHSTGFPAPVASRGRGLSSHRTRGFQATMGRGLSDFAYARARGLCHAYQAGRCTRGATCRYTHQNF